MQANLIVLPAKYAADFRALCARNPVPCPLLGETVAPGDPSLPARLAKDCDVRTDAPAYNVFVGGKLVATKSNILDEWQDDSIAFLIGCSFSFEAALAAGGLTPRQIEISRNVPMCASFPRQADAPPAFAGLTHSSLHPADKTSVPLSAAGGALWTLALERGAS